MDDDIRDRFRVPRRDFSSPGPRPHQPAPQPHHPTPLPQPKPVPSPIQPQNPFLQPKPTHHRPAAPQPHPVPKPNHPAPTHHKPAVHPQPAVHHHPKAHHQVKKTGKFKKVLLSLIILAVLSGAGAFGSLWVYPKYLKPNPFSADIQSKAQMSLFYPSKMPDGFTVDTSSPHLANNSVIYYANNGPKRLVFTLQKAPNGFDFGKFYDDQLKNSQQFSTELGQVVIGKNDSRFLGSLVSGTSWLLLSTNSTEVTYENMALVMHNLKKY